VLYIGVTNDLYRRIEEHKSCEIKGFTQKYNCDKLVYFEAFDYIEDAIAREKQLKNWKREWKNKLIETTNPDWKDLSLERDLKNERD
jgi:putative endonuclease